jgi:flagellar biosynthesis chaperone FliJ
LLILWLLGRRRKYLIEKNNTKEIKTTLSNIADFLRYLDTTLKQQSEKLEKLDKTINKLSESISNKSDEKGEKK